MVTDEYYNPLVSVCYEQWTHQISEPWQGKINFNFSILMKKCGFHIQGRINLATIQSVTLFQNTVWTSQDQITTFHWPCGSRKNSSIGIWEYEQKSGWTGSELPHLLSSVILVRNLAAWISTWTRARHSHSLPVMSIEVRSRCSLLLQRNFP